MDVTLPSVCTALRDLEKHVNNLSAAKRAVETAPDKFDMEDIVELNKAFTEVFAQFSEQAKRMNIPDSVAYAATFAEQVNARLPFVQHIRSLKIPTLTDYFEKKTKTACVTGRTDACIKSENKCGYSTTWLTRPRASNPVMEMHGFES